MHMVKVTPIERLGPITGRANIFYLTSPVQLSTRRGSEQPMERERLNGVPHGTLPRLELSHWRSEVLLPWCHPVPLSSSPVSFSSGECKAPQDAGIGISKCSSSELRYLCKSNNCVGKMYGIQVSWMLSLTTLSINMCCTALKVIFQKHTLKVYLCFQQNLILQ